MPKIICTLENAGTEINGIAFVPHDDGVSVISADDVKEPAYSLFLSIPGYVAHDEEPGKKETPAERKARLKAEKEAKDRAAEEKAAEEKAAAELAGAEAKTASEVTAPAQEPADDNEVF